MSQIKTHFRVTAENEILRSYLLRNLADGTNGNMIYFPIDKAIQFFGTQTKFVSFCKYTHGADKELSIHKVCRKAAALQTKSKTNGANN